MRYQVTANADQTFHTPTASHKKHLTGETWVDIYDEVFTGDAKCLSVGLALTTIVQQKFFYKTRINSHFGPFVTADQCEFQGVMEEEGAAAVSC